MIVYGIITNVYNIVMDINCNLKGCISNGKCKLSMQKNVFITGTVKNAKEAYGIMPLRSPADFAVLQTTPRTGLSGILFCSLLREG